LVNKAEAFSAIAGIVILVLATVWILGSQERLAESQKDLDEATAEMDRIVNRAVQYCEGSSSYECDVLISEWYEECKKEEYKIIPSCHDGRIANYLSKEPATEQITMSEECKELQEIMEQNRFGANNNDPIAIGEFGSAMNEYDELGCP